MTATDIEASANRDDRSPVPADTEILRVENLVKHFPAGRGFLGRPTGAVRAVDGLSFSLATGETLGIVGESGSGKSTAARAIVGLHRPTGGRVLFKGEDIAGRDAAATRRIRREMQFVFQDPFASLDPRMRIDAIVAEPFRIHGLLDREARTREVARLLSLVGLGPEYGARYPHQLSGGQRQRIGIARALALRPQLIVLDEPVSALDVSIQAQVVNLLRDLQADLGLAYVFIAHDLAIVRHMAHRIAVMYLGRMVEIGDREAIYARPRHPYTRALLSAVPVADPRNRAGRRRIVLRGEPPSPLAPPSGCRFRTRCFMAEPVCAAEEPPLRDVGGSRVACHFAEADPPPAAGDGHA